MAKKRAKREAVALEEGIASGMVQVKGMGKKKRAEKKAGLDRGLNEDGGAFRNGVLKIRGKVGGGSGRGGGSSGGGGRGGGKSGGGFKKGSRR
jgi:ribonuclease Z